MFDERNITASSYINGQAIRKTSNDENTKKNQKKKEKKLTFTYMYTERRVMISLEMQVCFVS